MKVIMLKDASSYTSSFAENISTFVRNSVLIFGIADGM